MGVWCGFWLRSEGRATQQDQSWLQHLGTRGRSLRVASLPTYRSHHHLPGILLSAGTNYFLISEFPKLLLSPQSSSPLSLWHLTLRSTPPPSLPSSFRAVAVPKLSSHLGRDPFPSSLSDFSALSTPSFLLLLPCIILLLKLQLFPQYPLKPSASPTRLSSSSK